MAKNSFSLNGGLGIIAFIPIVMMGYANLYALNMSSIALFVLGMVLFFASIMFEIDYKLSIILLTVSGIIISISVRVLMLTHMFVYAGIFIFTIQFIPLSAALATIIWHRQQMALFIGVQFAAFSIVNASLFGALLLSLGGLIGGAFCALAIRAYKTKKSTHNEKMGFLLGFIVSVIVVFTAAWIVIPSAIIHSTITIIMGILGAALFVHGLKSPKPKKRA